MHRNLHVERTDDEQISYIVMAGILDETADLKEVFTKLKPQVRINMEGIRRINSVGVREWIQAIDKIAPDIDVGYERCSPRIMEQTNYVTNFLGHGKVLSFFVPYFCRSCKKETDILLEVGELVKNRPVTAPTVKCVHCGSNMEFDDIAEEYFSFLNSGSEP